MNYPEPVKRLFEAFEGAGRDLYLVGGAVRDYELGATHDTLDDLDFCTDSRPEQTADILRRADISVYELGAEFGTVGAIVDGPADEGYPKDCQITTYRSEEYYRRGSRHPVVQFGDTIEQDLGRRDFSINSMACDGCGELIDPYDGKQDLQDGILRVVGDPWETLAEDPLRILRIGRFMSKLGFDPTDELRRAASRRAHGILDISPERWLQETTKLLKGPHVDEALVFLHDIRILGIILPEVDSLFRYHPSNPVADSDLWADTLRIVQQAPPTPGLRWTALLYHTGKRWTRLVDDDQTVAYPGHRAVAARSAAEIARRFRFDNDTAKQVQFLLRHRGKERAYHADWSDVQVREYVRHADPWVDSMLDLARAAATTADQDQRGGEQAQIDHLDRRIHQLADRGTLRPELPSGIGHDLMEAFALEPSPLIGQLKDWLDDQIIQGRLQSRREPTYYTDYLRQSPPDVLDEALAGCPEE